VYLTDLPLFITAIQDFFILIRNEADMYTLWIYRPGSNATQSYKKKMNFKSFVIDLKER